MKLNMVTWILSLNLTNVIMKVPVENACTEFNVAYKLGLIIGVDIGKFFKFSCARHRSGSFLSEYIWINAEDVLDMAKYLPIIMN